MLWANLGVASVVVGTLWNVASRTLLVLWLGALLMMSIVRAHHLRRFREASPGPTQFADWGRSFAFGSAVSGVLWGAAGAAFFQPGSTFSQSLLTFAIGGMVAAAAGTLSCHLPAFYAFFVPALLPLALRSIAEGDRMHLGLAALVVAYGIGMQRVARNNHRAFVRAFGLASENSELVARLERSQVELTVANRALEQRVAEGTVELDRQGQVLQAAQRLEVAGRLAGGLAHDFNSLLTVVLNNARLLKDSGALDEQGRLAAEETLEAAGRGATLIRQMLAFSSRNRTQPRVFDLNRLVGEWSSVMRHLLGEGVRVSVELGAESLPVRADSAQIEQVLVNLVTNAQSSLPSGGELHVSTRRSRKSGTLAGDYVELCVGDARDETASRPLELDVEPASDVEPQRRHLGLATVRAIIEHWDGRFSIETGAGGGACFCVSLPLTREALSPISDRKIEAAEPARGATVLVVDDEATLRSVMRRCLVREGFEVLVAPDGPRAIELAKSHGAGIDVLLTDVMMPGLSGVELAKRLLAERPELVVLFVSGYTFDETMPVIDTEQGTAFLPKPFDTKVLIDKVHELLAARPPRSRADGSRARVRPASQRPAEPG